jgi:hypothetical protein
MLYTEDKNKHNHERMGNINLKRRTDKYSREQDRIGCTHINP